MTLSCGSCASDCVLPDRLYNGQCLDPVSYCEANGQVFNTDLQTCVDPGGTCPTESQWTGCDNTGTVNNGTPPSDQYSTMVTYSYAYPLCGYAAGLTNVDVSYGNCPRVPQTSTISVNNNTSGSWTIHSNTDGDQSGSGSDSVVANPDTGGTIYTITAASVPGYAYPPTITNSKTGVGSSFLLFKNDTGTFTLSYATAFDYSLSNSGNTTILKGGRDTFGQVTVTKTLTSGSTQSTDLTVSGVPANVDYQVANATCSPSCQSTITFTVHVGASAGTYPITVTGTGGKTTSFNLVVQNSPDIIVTCSAAPTPALVGQNVTWNATVSGGVPPYTYVWSGTNMASPAPTTQSFSTTYSTVGAKTAQLHVTDSISNVGTCNPVGTVQINFNPQFKEI